MDLLIKSPHTELISVTTEFAHTDSQECYTLNKKRMNSDWYYWNNPISYKWNSLGYRMKEMSDVDYTNYIMFLGCSFVSGIGLHLEDTYPYKIAKQLGCDYVNAGLAGSSIEFTLNNLVYFLKRCPHKPRAIVVNWPDMARTFWWTKHEEQTDALPEFHLPQLTFPNSAWNNSYRDFIVNDANQHRRFDFVRETTQLLCSGNDIPLFEMATCLSLDSSIVDMYPYLKTYPYCEPSVTIPEVKNAYIDMIPVLHRSKARDMDKNLRAHVGIDHQQFITDDVVRFVEATNKNN